MRTITVLLAGAALMMAAQGFSTMALADSNPLQPNLDYGRTKDRPPRTPTVSELPSQIRLSKAIGGSVVSRNGTELGTIGDAWIDHDDRIGVVTLSGKKGTIPWNSLTFQGEPTPRFVVDLSPDDLHNAPPLQGAGLRDVRKDVLGAKIVDPQGKDLGTVHDIVASFSTGAIDAVVIETGSVLLPKQEHAVGWSAVRPAPNGKALVLSLSTAQLAQAPVMMTKAPEAARGGGNAAASGSSQAPATLGTSTVGRTTEPSTRR
jgi:sporulation protein YlmC with PRC-barrel domain